MLQIAGTDDIVVPIDGSLSTIGGWGGAPGLEGVMEFWADENACAQVETIVIDAINATHIRVYSDCTNDHEVHRYLIDEWGHEWPEPGASTGYSASEVIWDFFAKWTQNTTSTRQQALTVSRIEVYPNPASTHVRFTRAEESTSLLQVFSSAGALIASASVSGSTGEIDCSGWPDGMYVMSIDGWHTRFIKQ